MSKITEVTIVSPSEIQLNQDAERGDIIDLKLLQSVDTSFIDTLIKEKRDEEYNKFLQKEKQQWSSESQAEKADIINGFKLEKQQLESEKQALISKQDSIRKETELEADKKNMSIIADLKQQLAQLKSANLLELTKKDNQFIKERQDLILSQSEDRNKYEEKIRNLKTQLDNLNLQKSALNVKKLGEQLETWCNEEYNSYALTGFVNCTWNKDNKLVTFDDEQGRGTKADYIFRVYASQPFEKASELSSVCMDMKNENPDSVNRKKNADFYKKLNDDRIKKECQYAVLISELEMDSSNDVPVLKISEYPDMYRVRPQYFISFLGVIQSLALKFKDVLMAKNREELSFKDSKELLEEYNQLKETYLVKPLESMKKKVEEILKQADNIKKANDSIIVTANEIVNATLNTMREKIDRFDIKKITKKADKILNQPAD